MNFLPFLNLAMSAIGNIINWRSQLKENEYNRNVAIENNLAQIESAKELNAQNLSYARENRDYYNEVNTAERLRAAGYNPNLVHMSASSAQPAFQSGVIPANQKPSRSDAQIASAMRDQLVNTIKSTYYDALIKKEQYLGMKDDRERKNSEEYRKQTLWESETDKRNIITAMWNNFDRVVFSRGDNGLITLSPRGRSIAESFISNFQASLDKVDIANDNVSQRTVNLQQYLKNLQETEKVLQQKVAQGKLSESEAYQVLQVILQIIKTVKN